MKGPIVLRTKFLRGSALCTCLGLLLVTGAHAQPTNCATVPPGLVSWWRAEFDCSDSAGTNSGTPYAGVTFTPGEVGQAFSFDGTTNGYIEVPDAPELRLTNELTIEFWVKRQRLTFPGLPYADYVVEKGGDWTGGEDNYSAALHNPQYNYCLHFTFAGGWRGGGSIADTNTWHHCAITARNGDTDPILYIDGIAQPVVYSEGAATINLYPSTRPLHIGAQLDPNTGWFYYSQLLVDELSIYHRVLSAAEIQSIYDAGAAGKCLPPPTAPVITTQPANAFANAGGNALFNVGANGTSPLYYQWYFDNSPLANGTNQVLFLSNVSGSQAGTYFVVVSNAYGTATSSNATLTVYTTPPTITRQPQGRNVYAGANILFQVAASGSPTLTYQWQKDSMPLPGATTSFYRITNALVADSGAYSVVVTNPYGSVTSSNAVLVVRALPPCVAPPPGLVSWWRAETNQLDNWDSNDGIGLQTLYGPGKVGQAFLNPRVVVADSPTLHITNALTLQAWVNPTVLTGTTPYTIISKFDSPTLQGTGNQSSFWLGTTNNGYLYFLVSGTGSQRTNANVIGPSLPLNQWSFVVATYDGAALRLYVNGALAAQRAYSGGIFPGKQNLCIGAVPYSTQSTATYWPFSGSIDEVCIYNRALTDGEMQALYATDIIGMCLEPPVIVAQPQSQAVPLGEDVKFSVGIQGNRPLRYQWFFNSHPLQGATNSSLVLERIRTNQAGAYSVAATNSVGFALSEAADLTLLPAPTCTAPPDGAISWWPADNLPIDVVGTNNAALSVASYVTGKVGAAFSVSTAVAPPPQGRIQVANSPSLNFGSNADFSIEAWVKAFPFVPSVEVTFPPQGMVIVQKRPPLYFPPGPGYSLTLNEGRLAFWLSSSATITNPAVIANGPELRDSMFHHLAVTVQRAATNGGNLYVDGQLVQTFDPTSQRGSLSNIYPLYIASTLEQQLGDSSLRGYVDELAIYNRALSPDEIMAIRMAGAAGKCKVRPFITQQPTNQHVLLGGTATFTVGAGGPNLHYQWRLNGGNIFGATNSVYVRTQVPQAGTYSVLVTNGFGSVLSSNALLVINHAPVARCRNLIVPADANCLGSGSVNNGSSDPDGDPFTVTQIPPGPYPVGSNVVTLTVTDQWGASNSCNAIVVVQDQTPPTIICPSNIVVGNDPNQCGAVVTYSLPSATDLCSAVTNITVVPPPGSFFPMGQTLVQCAATDAAGNSATCAFTVTVRDTQPPAIVCPADITVTNAHDAWTSVVTFNPTASDNCPGVGSPVCNPPSGSAFSLGTNTVTCSVLDAAGNSNSCTFTITVRPGNVPPVPIIDVSPLAHFPGYSNLMVIAVNNSNTLVVFDGSRSYDVDDTNFLYFWYKGTNLFSTNVVAQQVLPLGTNTITLRLDDTFPLGTNSASVSVDVISLPQAVQIILNMVQQSGLPFGHQTALSAKLLQASRAFSGGNLSQGRHALENFVSAVNLLVEPDDPLLAAQLQQAVQQIFDALDRPAPGTTPVVSGFSATQQPNGHMQLRFAGQAGQTHIIEASTNMVDWQVIGVAADHGNGAFEFEDARAMNFPKRFYRVTAP